MVRRAPRAEDHERAGTAARPHLNQKERGVMTKTKVLGYLALVLLCTAVVLLLIALRGS